LRRGEEREKRGNRPDDKTQKEKKGGDLQIGKRANRSSRNVKTVHMGNGKPKPKRKKKGKKASLGKKTAPLARGGEGEGRTAPSAEKKGNHRFRRGGLCPYWRTH